VSVLNLEGKEVIRMKIAKIALLTLVACGVMFSLALAAGDVEKGKAMFNDPKLGGGTSGKSCNSCHPDGKGLEMAAHKKEWTTPGGVQKTLEGAVNTCITMALKGKALNPKSPEMANIVAYIKSLKGMKSEMPKKEKAVEGC
jgi:cytochrome c peroxidase